MSDDDELVDDLEDRMNDAMRRYVWLSQTFWQIFLQRFPEGIAIHTHVRQLPIIFCDDKKLACLAMERRCDELAETVYYFADNPVFAPLFPHLQHNRVE